MSLRFLLLPLSPAIALMNRMSFSRKLALLGLFVLVSLAASLYSLHFNFNQISHRARTELDGLELMRSLSETVQLVQQHRGASVGVLAGLTGFMPVRASKERLIDTATTDFERRLPAQGPLFEKWKDIASAWRRIQSEGLHWSPDESLTAHTQLIQQMLQLMSVLADEYELTVDASPDTFYLTHTASNELLMTLERLGQLRAHGVGLLARGKPSQRDIDTIKIDMALLDHELRLLKAGLQKVARYNPDLQATASSSYLVIENAALQAIHEVRLAVLSDPVADLATGYMTAMTSAIDHGYDQLHAALLPTARGLIEARRQQATWILQLANGTATVLLLLTIYLLSAFYHATRRSIASLSRSVSDFARGDMRHRIHLETHDELSEIGDSFNVMAGEITELIELRKDASARIHAIFESAPDAMVQMNADGNISGWNKQAQNMLDWAPQEVLGRPLHEVLIPARHRAAHLQGLAHFLATGNGPLLNTRAETSALHRNGQELPVEIALSSFLVQGRYEFNAFIHDISERKTAEQKLQLAARVFNEAREGIAITDPQAIYIDVNPTFCEITGYTREEMIGKHTRMLSSGRHNAEFYAAMWTSIHAAGSWSGEIWNRRKDGTIYPQRLTISTVKDPDGVVIHYISTFIDITQSKAAEEEIRSLAFYDALTHLPNRRLLQDRLRHALASRARTDRHGAILFIDLDNFKSLNDSLGHDMGDLLLQQVAQRLVACVRQGDTVARLGGDEFVVMLDDLGANALEARAQTQRVGEKILATLAQPYHLRGHTCHNTPSIGATLFCGQYNSPEELLKQADVAMYESKSAGRNTLRFFDREK
jgi:diguanylate cyclase (GGDEF)-like protein/PAS domain S-box-containing protein